MCETETTIFIAEKAMPKQLFKLCCEFGGILANTQEKYIKKCSMHVPLDFFTLGVECILGL